MSKTPAKTGYGELVERTLPAKEPQKDAEFEVDALITNLQERKNKTREGQTSAEPDQMELLRRQTMEEYIPIFVELMEKYRQSGITMEMDASNFLQGGREMSFEFALGEYRAKLMGTVTTEGIAFHETRYTPEVRGELVSGPMLRLRSLNADTFRKFVCARLALLLKSALQGR